MTRILPLLLLCALAWGQELPLPTRTTPAPAPRKKAKPAPRPAPRPAPAPPAPEPEPEPEPVALPPTVDLGRFCVARSNLHPGHQRPILWRGDYETITPPPGFLDPAPGAAPIPANLLPLVKVLRLKGTPYFGRAILPGHYLLVGPGVLKGLRVDEHGRELVDPQPRHEAGHAGFLFAFAKEALTLFPATGEEPAAEALAIAFTQGRLTTTQGEGNVLIPFSQDGVLAVTYAGFEARGLFHFPLSEGAIPVQGVRWGDELWLESAQPRLITLAAKVEEAKGLRKGVHNLDRPRILRLKVKLGEPRSVALCFVVKGREDSAFWMGGDLQEQSALALAVPGARIKDLPELKAATLTNAAAPGWGLDASPAGFLALADAAFIKAGFHGRIFTPQFQGRKASSEAYLSLATAMAHRASLLQGKVEYVEPSVR